MQKVCRSRRSVGLRGIEGALAEHRERAGWGGRRRSEDNKLVYVQERMQQTVNRQENRYGRNFVSLRIVWNGCRPPPCGEAELASAN